jgi:hypothetical protein
VAEGAALGLGVERPSLPIPQEGLSEVLRGWSGQGRLWEALAAVEEDEPIQRRWTRTDTVRRAHRILLAQLEPTLVRWPMGLQVFLDALPAESLRSRVVTRAPAAGTSWSETYRRFGWPPRAFAGRERSRIADTFLVTSVRWTLDLLMKIWRNAVSVEPTVDIRVRRQLEVADQFLELEPLASAEAQIPTGRELRALAGSGYPWNVVGKVTQELRALDTNLEALARRLVSPEFLARFFHLGVLGVILVDLKELGATLVSVRPLSATTIGPAYLVTDAAGHRWDLWFEAAGVWSFYGEESPYARATAELPGSGRLGADIMLLRRGVRALIFECKYSESPEVVGRRGITQAFAYAVEARTKLAPHVSAMVVCPEDVVGAPSVTETAVGPVGVLTPGSIRDRVKQAMES